MLVQLAQLVDGLVVEQDILRSWSYVYDVASI